ncbi:MAG: type II secretion system protein, partial [Planctomycetes bacterium]|nr:type II secretion system protein [Planctomycetota bacterium]
MTLKRASTRHSKPLPHGGGFFSIRRGFTIIELLVVVSIIGLLLALLVPAIGKARDSALQTQSLANLRNLSAACNNYGAAWSDRQMTMLYDDFAQHIKAITPTCVFPEDGQLSPVAGAGIWWLQQSRLRRSAREGHLGLVATVRRWWRRLVEHHGELPVRDERRMGGLQGRRKRWSVATAQHPQLQPVRGWQVLRQ